MNGVSILLVVGGDFNEILTNAEKDGGPFCNFLAIEGFRRALADCNLMDIKPRGP